MPPGNLAKKDLDDERISRWQLVVIATSNDTGKLPKAMRDRFDRYEYRAGEAFARACYERLAWIWCQETDRLLPNDYKLWGWDTDGDDVEFSMRRALRMMQRYLRC